jgi:putative Holliday junction resolvase
VATVEGVLALDVGQARTGVARGSISARLAEPLTSLPSSQVLDKLADLIKQHDVGLLVVGLPRSLGGRDTAQTTWVRRWVDKLKAKTEIPVYWQDEALTSKQANSYRLSAKSAFDEHALAAAVILQDFLDSVESERVLA